MFFSFSQNFECLGQWKSKKWPKMTKNSVCCTLHCRSHISYDPLLWYTWMYKRILSPCIFLISWVFKGGGEVSKRAKPDLKLLISVCFALYLRNCRSCHQDDHNGISRCFHFCFIIFLKKYTIVNAKIILFFIGPVLKFFF